MIAKCPKCGALVTVPYTPDARTQKIQNKRAKVLRREARRLALSQMSDFRAQLRPLKFYQRFNVLIRILFKP